MAEEAGDEDIIKPNEYFIFFKSYGPVLLEEEIITGSGPIPFLSQSDIYRLPTKEPPNAA